MPPDLRCPLGPGRGRPEGKASRAVCGEVSRASAVVSDKSDHSALADVSEEGRRLRTGLTHGPPAYRCSPPLSPRVLTRTWVMTGQFPGPVGLQTSSCPPSSVRTVAFTACCLFLPTMKRPRSLWPTAGRRRQISVPPTMPVFPVAPRWSTTSSRFAAGGPNVWMAYGEWRRNSTLRKAARVYAERVIPRIAISIEPD